MDRRKQKESDAVETAAKVAVGAAAAYGCYKLCQTIFDSKSVSAQSSQRATVEQSSMHPPPSLGDKVANVIDGMQLAYTGAKLCEAVMDALPRDDPPQRVQTTPRPLESVHSTLYPHLSSSYPHPIQPEQTILPAQREISNRGRYMPSVESSTASTPKLTGEDVVNAMKVMYTGYELFQSIFGTDSSDSTEASSNYRPNARVVVVETDKQSLEALKKIKEHCREYKVLGFECEWVQQRNTRLPISLIQLATNQSYCALFRLNKLKRLPPMLKEILTDPNIIKVSTAPDADASYLLDDYNVFMKSVLDLRFMAREAGYRNPGGLTSMSKQFLRILLDESWYLRKSDWNASYLASDQIDFAKEKCQADIKLFQFFAEEIAPERRFNGEAQHLMYIIENHCSKYLNRKYQ